MKIIVTSLCFDQILLCLERCFTTFCNSISEGEENEVERTDDKTKSSKNEEIRLRLGSTEQSHGQNHLPQYRLNNQPSHKTYKGKKICIFRLSHR